MELKVKTTFFLKGEAYDRAKAVDPFITDSLPHYELEDGTIVFGHIGYAKYAKDETGAGVGIPRIWYSPIIKDEPKSKLLVPEAAKIITDPAKP